jgi:hypothetical protein
MMFTRNLKAVCFVALVGCGGTESVGSSSASLLPGGGFSTPSVALCALEDLTFDKAGNTFTFYSDTNSTGTKAHVAANRDLYLGTDTHIGGHAVAGRNLTAASGVSIDRSAIYGGTAVIANRTKIAGGRTQRASTPCASVDIDAYMAAAALTNDNARLAAHPVIAPFLVGGGLSVPSGVRFTMPAGIYHFAYVSIGRNATIEIKNRDTVYWFVSGAIQLGSGVVLETHPGLQHLWIATDSAMPIDLSASGTAGAHVVAPRAEVRFLSRSMVMGSVLARAIKVGSGGRVRFVGIETETAPGTL